jgi:alkaline phosphatase D
MAHDDSSLTRRQILAGAGSTGLLAAAGPLTVLGAARPASAASASGGGGTPEQIHLTWGADPASSVTVSWASPGQATGARVQLRRGGGFGRTVRAIQRTYTDGINGETVWTYHASSPGSLRTPSTPTR